MTMTSSPIIDPMDGPDQVDVAPAARITCKATSRTTGKQCGRSPIPGATVCKHHGGAAPQVKRKAAIRLLELVDPAITTLAREMVNADKSSDRQRAANSILDRAGVPRVVTNPDGEAAKDLLIERLRVIREQQMQDDNDDAMEELGEG